VSAECLKSLSFPEINDRFHDIEKPSSDTCAWLLEHETYRTWLKQAPQYLLCIKGKPGAGKSTLMKFVINNQAPQKLVIHFFFHARGTSLQKTPLGFYRSLLHQLLYRISPLRPDFRVVYRAKTQTHEKWHWHVNELQELLTNLLKKAVKIIPIVIYVDALDESGSTEEQNLTYYLQRIAADIPIKICISCRHYPTIQLNNFAQICVEEENMKDIAKHIEMTFEEKWNVAKGPNLTIVEQIKEDILNRSSGTFLWVYLTLQTIDKLSKIKTWKIIQKKIREIPKGLMDLYTHIFSHLDGDEDDQLNTSVLLRWISLAKRPLSPNKLRIAMAFDTDMPHPTLESWRQSDDYYGDNSLWKDRITYLSGGLAEVVRHGTSFSVQFIHESVNNYLLTEGISMLGIKPAGNAIGQCHNQMARSCIYYLKCPEIRDPSMRACRPRVSIIANMSAGPGWRDDDEDDEVTKEDDDEEEVDDNDEVKDEDEDEDKDEDEDEDEKRHHHDDGDADDDDGDDDDDEEEEEEEEEGRKFIIYAIEGWLWHAEQAENNNCSQEHILTWFDFPNSTFFQDLLCFGKHNYSSYVFYPGSTFLHIASHGNLVSLAMVLLRKHNFDINITVPDGRTALHVACHRGAMRMVELLLEEKADVNACSNVYDTPLRLACARGDKRMVELLLTKGANVNAGRGLWGYPLEAAAASDSKALVEMLLERGANVDARSLLYGNALETASTKGFKAVVEILLNKGANVNLQGGIFGNALQAASFGGSKAVVRLLLNKGADVNAQGGDYFTALRAAKRRGHFEVANILLEAGADETITPPPSETRKFVVRKSQNL
jgi:ankyrin repeat protein